MSINIVESIGYTVERIHSGLLAHLFIEGRDTPHGDAGKRFLDALGVGETYAKIGNAVPEWKNIDLVLTSADKKTPIVAFEFKVDSRERKSQMQRYRDRLNSKWAGVPLFYVTLGMSGVHKERREKDPKVEKWLDLAQFLDAVRHTSPLGCVYEDWTKALSRELTRRNAFEQALPKPPGLDFRPGAWNVYLMASLRRELVRTDPNGVWGSSSIWGIHLTGLALTDPPPRSVGT